MMSVLTFTLSVDWDKDGFGAGDDLPQGVMLSLSITRGISDYLRRVADVGRLTVELDNTSRDFSPSYTGGSYYGKLLPALPVRLTASDGTNTWVLFRGYTVSWQPEALLYGKRTCTLVCEGVISRLRDVPVELPLQHNIGESELIKKVISAAFGGARASAAYTLSSSPEWCAVGGKTYTFVTSLSGTANEVLVGATATESAENLAAAVNAGEGAGTKYTAATTRNENVVAYTSGATITFKANCPGTWGNNLTLQYRQDGVTSAETNLAGGSDEPSGLLDIDTSVVTLDYAADKWGGTEKTNALWAIEDVARTAFGMFWEKADGTLVYRNKNSLQKGAATSTPSLIVNNNAHDITGALSRDRIFNHVEINMTPRTTLTTGVIARARGVVEVPPTTSPVDRQSNFDNMPTSSEEGTVVKLPFTDVATGNIIGATEVIHPVAGTDYTVNELRDGTGFDYTYSGNITMALAQTGSGVEATLHNAALGSLFVFDLQVRGTALVAFEPRMVVEEDTSSVSKFGKLALTYDMPLPADENHTRSIAWHILAQYADARFEVQSITFSNADASMANGLLSVEIGDIIRLDDTQLGISSEDLLVLGVDIRVREPATFDITYTVTKKPSVTVWILDVSELDSTTVLGY